MLITSMQIKQIGLHAIAQTCSGARAKSCRRPIRKMVMFAKNGASRSGAWFVLLAGSDSSKYASICHGDRVSVPSFG